ncbi:acyltransferase [Kutzneria viridogrisea]|uniref:Acyltransferase n=2 Tax=Kutzneria TaxID=43356 RepID=W5W0K9_9PSEU|nr:acyltransferase [Kutzneria albida]AHH94698.1 acyltransferase [Kutzneria albida DSM 43870]MBA8930366.1 peptidoglycan/LPS O-acetylase OafA/YrhL [Kutzneria viridogrisea]
MKQPLSHAEYLALKRFPALDGLRAIAALMVVFFHNNGPEWLQGWIGVQIFFVISGYLITTLMLREEDRSGRVSFKNFYTRRVFRILPVYFVVLGLTLVGLLVSGRFTTTPPGTELPLYLFFFNEFGHGGDYGQSWSLGIEQKFYLLWPVLAFSAIIASRGARFGKRVGLTLVLMALSLAAVPFTVASDPRGWPSHYFSILIGCLVAILMHYPKGYALIRPLTRPWVASTLAGVFVLFHLLAQFVPGFVDRTHLFGDVPGFVVVCPPYVLVVAVVLLPALIANAFPQWLLSRKPMVFLGERSYSIYLVQGIAHVLVAGLCMLLSVDLGSSPLLGFPVALVAVGLAHFCYLWVEKPMIKVGQGVISRRKAAAASAAAAPAEPVKAAD